MSTPKKAKATRKPPRQRAPKASKCRLKKPKAPIPKNLGGRPSFQINYTQLQELVKIQCTGQECAVVLGCSYETLNKRLREDYAEAKKTKTPEELHQYGDGFLDYSKKFSKLGYVSLRRAQYQLAVEDKNASMLKHLGVNILKQSDKLDLSSSDGTMSPAKQTNELTREELAKELEARGLPTRLLED